MHFDVFVVLGSLIVGVAVGLTGMGGGALMTPVLVLVFGVHPLAAVSSDLVASFVMKPVGGLVHLRKRTVHWGIVGWLCAGSVPAALLGALSLHAVGKSSTVQHVVQLALGAALLVAAAGLATREVLLHRRGRDSSEAGSGATVRPRPLPTIAVGAVGGFIVGVTSVGSGTLIVVCLLILYPTLHTREVVGTDLVQAVPLVGAAALGHVLFGNLQLGLTAAVIAGSVPGAFLGAQISVRATGWFIRPALCLVLLGSALKLFSVGTTQLGTALVAALVVGAVYWILARAKTLKAPGSRTAGSTSA